MAQMSGMPPTSPANGRASHAARRKGPGRIAMEVVLWAVQLGLVYFIVTIGAIPALTADKGAKGAFEEIGVGLWLMYLTGVLEVLGSIALLTPWFSGIGAIGLFGVLAGAAMKHLTLDGGEGVETPAMLLVGLLIVALGRWGTVVTLFKRLFGGNRA
jgi:putative oxidoreductase